MQINLMFINLHKIFITDKIIIIRKKLNKLLASYIVFY